MKFFAVTTALAATASAHSWLGCTKHDNGEILKSMQAGAAKNVLVDPLAPEHAKYCKGWPRNKANPGNWITESTHYTWNIAANKFKGEMNACHPSQRAATYHANAPMASAKAGEKLRLMFGGNGHARGAGVGGNPGTVTVYWKGKPNTEITSVKEFTAANKLQSNGFSEDSFSYPANPAIKDPTQGLVDKGNWQVLNLPANMAKGRHMMVWVWSYQGADQWSTCFDVNIV